MTTTIDIDAIPENDCRALLRAYLLSQGFRDGTPSCIPEPHQDIDREVAGRMRCPCCRVRGLTWEPYHKGTRYAALAWCPNPACLFAEEM